MPVDEGYVYNLAARIACAVRDGNKPVLEALVRRATTQQLCVILEALYVVDEVCARHHDHELQF